MNNYEHFVTIVAGNNPDELMKRYIKGETEYATVKKEDAHRLKENHINMAKAYLNTDVTEFEKLELEDIIESLELMTDDEFFESLKEENDIDENGNVLIYDDSNIMVTSYNIGKNLSMPFITINGEETFQTLKKNIDWQKIHLKDKAYYERVWEITMEGSEPSNDDEMKIKRMMGNRQEYFSFFKNKETYASHCSAFWGYAFVSEETNWVELTPNKNQIDWVLGYYDTFIKPLPENTLLTIYECRK